MATSRFVRITDKEINKIKTNSILKNTERPNKIWSKTFSRYIFHFQYK